MGVGLSGANAKKATTALMACLLVVSLNVAISEISLHKPGGPSLEMGRPNPLSAAEKPLAAALSRSVAPAGTHSRVGRSLLWAANESEEVLLPRVEDAGEPTSPSNPQSAPCTSIRASPSGWTTS